MRRALILLVCLFLGSCSSMPSMNPLDWFSSNSGGAKPAELVNIASPRAMKTLWRADIGGAGPHLHGRTDRLPDPVDENLSDGAAQRRKG